MEGKGAELAYRREASMETKLERQEKKEKKNTGSERERKTCR
jgi:hypothetical protein